MVAKNTISLRIENDLLQQIQEKCPDANRSVLLNNVLRYILSQDNNIIQNFAIKNH